MFIWRVNFVKLILGTLRFNLLYLFEMSIRFVYLVTAPIFPKALTTWFLNSRLTDASNMGYPGYSRQKRKLDLYLYIRTFTYHFKMLSLVNLYL